MNDERHQTVRAGGAPRAAAERPPQRRTYRRPRLTALGDLRGLTFGGSPGINDSGAALTQEPPV